VRSQLEVMSDVHLHIQSYSRLPFHSTVQLGDGRARLRARVRSQLEVMSDVHKKRVAATAAAAEAAAATASSLGAHDKSYHVRGNEGGDTASMRRRFKHICFLLLFFDCLYCYCLFSFDCFFFSFLSLSCEGK
jgi:hypothetical protein